MSLKTGNALLDSPPFEALSPLGRVVRMANFRAVGLRPPAVGTDDHRAVLLPAWAAHRQGLFGDSPPVLVRFDAHPDLGERPRPWAWEKSLLRDVDEVLAVANMQRPDDGGWVCSALQFGLARSCATFFLHDYHRFPGDHDALETHDGRRCELWSYASVGEFLDGNGAKESRLRDELVRGPVWLDIDLDFATRRSGEDDVELWDEARWDEAFPPPVRTWLEEVLGRTALLTFSSEPEFCGGWAGVGATVGALRRVWPETSDALENL